MRRAMLLVPLVLLANGCAGETLRGAIQREVDLAGSTARQKLPPAAPQKPGTRVEDDSGDPALVVFTSSSVREPVDVTDSDFKAFMRTRGRRVSAEEFNSFMLELGARLRQASRPDAARLVFASWQPPGDEAQGEALRDYLNWCRPLDRCISLRDDSHSFGPETRRAIALDIALNAVWPGIVEALQGMMNIHQLKVMLVTSLVVYFALLAAPEPVSKLIAAKLTYILLGYLGVSTLWQVVDGWTQLGRELEATHSFEAVRAAGERFGMRMGAQVSRVLVMLITWRLGGSLDRVLPEIPLPGVSTASNMLAMEGGGIGFSAAGAVRSVALSADRVSVAFSSGAVVAAARGASQTQKPTEGESGNRSQPRPPRNIARIPVAMAQAGTEKVEDCRWHHIATDKNEESDARGGPWTPIFQRIFDRAGLSLNDAANMVCVIGHKGPHPREYHELVFERLVASTSTCSTVAQCRADVVAELARLRRTIATPGTKLNRLVTIGTAP